MCLRWVTKDLGPPSFTLHFANSSEPDDAGGGGVTVVVVSIYSCMYACVAEEWKKKLEDLNELI